MPFLFPFLFLLLLLILLFALGTGVEDTDLLVPFEFTLKRLLLVLLLFLLYEDISLSRFDFVVCIDVIDVDPDVDELVNVPFDDVFFEWDFECDVYEDVDKEEWDESPLFSILR